MVLDVPHHNEYIGKMEKAKNILQIVTLLLLMVVGAGEVYGQNTVIADIDFSNPITDGVVAGRVNTMAIGANGNNPTTINSDGRLVLGNTANTVTIPEQQRDGQIVQLSFDFAFGKLVGKEVYFNLKDAYNTNIASFSYQPYYNSITTDLGITATDLPANDSNTPDWTNRSVTFTITLNYYSNQITTRTSIGNTDHTVSMTNTAPLAAFVVGSSYNNSARYCQFDNLLIKSTTNYCSYSVKATVNSAFHSIIASGTVENGSSVTIPYSRFLLIDNLLYSTSTTNQEYRKTFAPSNNGEQLTIDYANSVSNVIFYTETEDIGGVNSQDGQKTRTSMGRHGYTNSSSDYKSVTTLNVGCYQITAFAINGNNTERIVNYKIENEVHTFTQNGRTGLTEHTLSNIAVMEPSTLYFASEGSTSSGVDNFYIQAILAFKEAGGSYIVGQSGINPTIFNTTGQTITYSTPDDNVVKVESNGTWTMRQTGRVWVTATAGGYIAKYLVTVRSTTDAIGTLAYDETTHRETFTISGTGNFDTEHFEGQRILFDVGNPNEVQQVNGDGLYSITDNGTIRAELSNGIPVSGTYFTFTPKTKGKLSVTGTTGNTSFNIHLVNSAGAVLGTKTSVANTETTYTFSTQLQPDETYYVYAESGWWAFFLKSFTFDATQSETTTISVSDLLYAEVDGGINSTGNKLDRFIPGFALEFSGGDGATVYNSDRITFYQNTSGVGQMVITPRLMSEANEGDVVFTAITLNYSAIETGKATSALVNGQTAYMAEGSTSVRVDLATEAPSITVRYGSDTDDNSFVLTSMTIDYKVTGRELLEEVLDMSKTATQLTFEKSEYYVSYGETGKGQQAYFTIPSGHQGYLYGEGFNGTISYSSADPSVATVSSSNGTVTIINNVSSETTISAQFVGTKYFLPSAEVTYTVKSAQLVDNAHTYTIEHVRRGMVVEATISGDGESVLSFSNTIATSQTVNNADGQLISTYAFDNGGSDDEFNVVISYVSGANAYVQSARAYYLTPELKLNYTPQAIYNHHGNWTDDDLQNKFANNIGVATCFDLEGMPTFSAVFDGKDYTADFVAPTTASEFSKTGNIEWVTDPATTPKATIRSTGSGTTITDATVFTSVSLKSTAMGYDPGVANNTATAHLSVIPFPYTWDLTSGSFAAKTKALELVNITDDGNAYLLMGPGSVKVESTGNMGRTAVNYYIDETLPNSRLRIPVMQGMKVSVTCYGAEERVTSSGYPLQISNVTDLRGNATATLEIKTVSNKQDFIAKNNGYVEIYNRSDVNVYIHSITVSAPYLIFEDGENPKISKTATYQNLVVNKPVQATLTYSDDDQYNAKIATRETDTGTYTFQSNANGNVTVTAQATGARNLEPCWGQYTILLVDFYFNPNVVNLTHSISSVSYPTSTFLSYAHLYLDNKDWLNMTAEEKSKISFSVAAPATYNGNPNPAVGIVKETGDVNNPYIMEIRNDGQLIITAVYRDNNTTVKTTCTVNITKTAFEGFRYPAPTVDANKTTYTFGDAGTDNELDSNTRDYTNGYYVYYIDKNGTAVSNLVSWNGSTPSLDLTAKGSGVYCVVAVHINSDTPGDYYPLASFYLTKAYPVTEDVSQSWDFRSGLHDSNGNAWDGVEDNKPLFERANDGNDWTRGMPTNRASDYRYLWEVNGNNGFIVRETAGLVVIADAPTCDRSVTDGVGCDGHFSAYSGSKYNYVYPNIGLHRSTLIIPHLPKGAYVAVAWDRTSENDGNTVVVENLLDLEGHTIDVIRYGGSVRLTGTNAGNNQGYYTFRVANDGNVTFTQNDKGTSRIIAIHVYYGNPDISVNASDDIYYNRNAVEEFKGSGMTQTLMAYARANADGTADVGSGLMSLDAIMTADDVTTSQWLTNYLNFNAPNGVAEFKMVTQDETLHNMTMDMSQTYFDSGNGRYAVPGLSFNGACWGKAVMSVGVRDNNGYLVAYRQYRFTVGMRPKMQYPKTWDFTRFFDNSTVKIEDSPVTVLPATVGLNTKNSLIVNTGYPENTEDKNILDTSPTRTWDADNILKRSSGDETHHQYGHNEYSSYYVDNAMLVCNKGDRNTKGFIIEETRGLGFNIAESGNSLQWVMPDRNVGYAGNAYLLFNGTMTIAGVGDDYKGYYVFLRSDKAPNACSENVKSVYRGDYRGIVSNNDDQYIFEVNSPDNMTMTFNSDTKIYGIAVTNIKKETVHPVGGTGWATESRDIDIDHTLTGYYTIHPLKAYEVKYDSYDMNTATVYLSEIKNTTRQTDSEGMEFYDHGYVEQGNGIVLKEAPTDEASVYAVPLFVPAITTTHPAAISNNNMMRPNIIRKEYHESDVADNDNIFILTNVHWKYSVTSEWGMQGEEYIENRNGSWQAYGSPTIADAAGFYRLHIKEDAAANTMAANTAYLQVPADQLPIALWNSSTVSGSSRSGTIGIRELGVTDSIDEMEANGLGNRSNFLDGWYSLDGMKLDDPPTKPGLYIHNGRKVVK